MKKKLPKYNNAGYLNQQPPNINSAGNMSNKDYSKAAGIAGVFQQIGRAGENATSSMISRDVYGRPSDSKENQVWGAAQSAFNPAKYGMMIAQNKELSNKEKAIGLVGNFMLPGLGAKIQQRGEKRAGDKLAAQANAQAYGNYAQQQIANQPQYNYAPMMAMGGKLYPNGGTMINYTGQTHEGADEGIAVDAQGNPTAITERAPVGLVEGGEVSYKTKDGNVFVFSDRLGYANTAKKIMGKYKNADNDPIQKRGMDKELERLANDQETIKAQSQQQQQEQMPVETEQNEETMAEYKNGGVLNDKQKAYIKFIGAKLPQYGGGGKTKTDMFQDADEATRQKMLDSSGFYSSIQNEQDVTGIYNILQPKNQPLTPASKSYIDNINKYNQPSVYNRQTPWTVDANTGAFIEPKVGVQATNTNMQYQPTTSPTMTTTPADSTRDINTLENTFINAKGFKTLKAMGGKLPKYDGGGSWDSEQKLQNWEQLSSIDNDRMQSINPSTIPVSKTNSVSLNQLPNVAGGSSSDMGATQGKQFTGNYNWMIPAAQTAGNLAMLAAVKKTQPKPISAEKITPREINLAPQRAQITAQGMNMQKSNQMAMRNAGMNPTQYMSAVGVGNVGVQRATNEALLGSALSEQQANVGTANQMALANAQRNMQAEMYNKQMQGYYNQQKLGVMADIARTPAQAMRDNQSIRDYEIQSQRMQPYYNYMQDPKATALQKILGRTPTQKEVSEYGMMLSKKMCGGKLK